MIKNLKIIKKNFLLLGVVFGITLGFAFSGLFYNGLTLTHWILMIGFAILSLYGTYKVSKVWDEIKKVVKDE